MAWFLIIALMGILFFQLSCANDSNSPTALPDTTIGPAGGTVSSDGGVSVLIPPGALSEDTEISVTTLANNATLPGSMASYLLECSGGGVFLPHGTIFAKPVTITMPLETALDPGDSLALFTWDEELSGWEETPFVGVVSLDGLSVQAQVTHFSTIIFDASIGGDGFFPEFDFDQNPYYAFSEMYNYFLQHVYSSSIRVLPNSVGCCFRIKQVIFDLEYVDGAESDNLSHTDGTMPGDARIERFIIEQGSMESGRFCRLVVHVSMDYYDPNILILTSSYERYLDISQGEASTPIRGTFNCSNRFSNTGGLIEFTVDGPGSVTPSRIPTANDWEVVFTSSERGTAEVTATFVSCEDEPSQSPSRSIEIVCLEATGWWVALEIDWSHSGNGVDWDFADKMTIIADLVIDPEQDPSVTGDISDGNHVVTVGADHCDVTDITAPDFLGGTLWGSKVGQTVQFSYFPDPLNFFLSFSLYCEHEPEPPFTITIPYYANLEATILSEIVFTLPLVDNEVVTGSGEGGLGVDPPVQYSYTATISTIVE